MSAQSSYVERPPAPALAGLVTTVWLQQVGDDPLAQRHMPHGGAEVRCLLGGPPRLLGPLTSATYRHIPAGGTVVGMRLRPGVVTRLTGMPADELTDSDVAAADLWRGAERLTDALGSAATPERALAYLQAFVAGPVDGDADPLVSEAVRRLQPGRDGGTAALPAALSISERQLRRRCRAAVGVGPKELHRILRLQGFIARVQASIAGHGCGVDLARGAVDAGYHDQAHLGHECRRLLGVTPGEFLAQSTDACGGGHDHTAHDHTASFAPILRRGTAVSYKNGATTGT